jgi:hypothetical protein
MQNHVIGQCPICDHDLVVKTLACTHCHTEINGEFLLSKFNYLNKESLYFIELFVKNKGNIKKLEKEMNVSYPTIKKYLDDVITKLGYTPDEDKGMTQKEILEKLSKKEISKEDAMRLIGGHYE